MFALVDANNMYVSCERVFAPRLAGKPVVVLSSNDGACIARSNEAKELGVEMAQPWFQVRHLERTAGLIALSANFEMYGDMSRRMMSVAARFSPRQEVYSIDESFLDFTGVRGDLTTVGRDLRAAVLKETGLPTSVGFGPTKTLAKLANHIAKTADRKPGYFAGIKPGRIEQVCNLAALTQAEREGLFRATEVGAVWGVGKKTGAKLQEAGIRTVQDLIQASATTLRRQFSVVLEKTVLELRGTPCLDIDEAPSPKQQILVSRSFATSVTSADGIVEAVSEFASRCAEKLREQHCSAGAVGVFFMTSPHRPQDRQHQVSVTTPLERPSADTRLLVSTAVSIARQQFRSGFNYAKAGVMLLDLQETDRIQDELDLFGDPAPGLVPGQAQGHTTGLRPQQPDRPDLMRAMDALNQRFGRDAIRIGSATIASNGGEARSWSSKQDRRSPRYTTRWDEMPVVKA